MTPPRIALLGFSIECNRFAPVATQEDFEARTLMGGPAMLTNARLPAPSMLGELPGFIADMDAAGSWEPVPSLLAMAEPNGPVDAAFFGRLMENWERDLKEAGPLDGVYCVLHGAGLTTDDDDPEGTLLGMVRRVRGNNIPLVASYDLHANVSAANVELVNAYIGYRTNPHLDMRERGNLNEIFVALHDTITRFDLPLGLFEDLLSAFKQDVVTTRYASWHDVLDYCRRSANPVGRLVLRLSGYRDAELDRAADAVCTALQLTNFWQDLAIDWPRGRLYVPEEVWRAAGADPAVLDRGRMTPEWTAAMRACGHYTRRLFADGRPVCDGVSGRLRYELRATWLGGSRILNRLEAVDFDVFTARPSLRTSDAIVIAFGTALWRRHSSAP